MTNQEIASLLGVHVKYVPVLRRKPGFPGSGTAEDLTAWHAEYKHRAGDGDLSSLRAALLREQAELTAAKKELELLRLQQEEGSLVKESAAREAIAAVLRPLRLKLDALPARKAPELNPADPPHAETVLREAIEEIYADLQADGHGLAPAGQINATGGNSGGNAGANGANSGANAVTGTTEAPTTNAAAG